MSFICEQSAKVKLEMGCKTLYVWELKLQLPLASPENCFFAGGGDSISVCLFLHDKQNKFLLVFLERCRNSKNKHK